MSLGWLGSLTSRLRNKIVLPYIILTLILALVSTFLLTGLIIGPVQDRVSNFLQDAAREANQALIEKQRDQLASLRAMLHTEGMASAVASRSTLHLRSLLLPIKLNDRLDAVEVVDGEGRELLGILHGPDPEALSDYRVRSGADLSAWPLVARLLASPGQAQDLRRLELVETERGYVLYSGAPVILNGDLVGSILVGNYVSNVVEQIGLRSLAQITLYDPNGRLLGSTVPNAAEPASPFARMRADVRIQLADAGGALRADLSWQERSYAALYAPLYLGPEEAGYLSVVLPIDFLVESAAQTQVGLILLFGLASFAVLVIGYLLAERITAPLQELMLASQQVARGDFSKRIQARSGDEIGTLASAFNAMNQNLQVYADQLRQRITELSQLYEASTALGRSLNLRQVMEIAVDIIYRTGQLDFVLLLLKDRATGLYVYGDLQAQDRALEEVLEKSVAFRPGPLQEAFQQRSSFLVATAEAAQVTAQLGLGNWRGALLLIPLLAGEEPLGLVVGGKAQGEGSGPEASMGLLRILAAEAARAIQNALLYEEVTQRLQQLLTVQQVSQAITAKLSLTEVLDQIMQELVGILRGGSAVLALTDPRRGELQVRATRGLAEDVGEHWPGRAVAEWVVAQGRAVMYDQEALSLLSFPGDPPAAGNAMCVPLSVEGEVIGAVDVRNRDPQHHDLDRQDMLVLTTVANQAAVALKNAQLYEELRSLYLSVVRSLAAAIDARDPSTHGHSHRVTRNTLAVARQLSFPARDLRSLEIASYLHDIGKIGVRDGVLLKPGKLSREERKHIDDHPLIGARILEPVGFDSLVLGSVLHHHERYDGNGYPHGLREEEIPLGARILGTVDAFDAMISDRPYRRAITPEEAIEKLQEGAGTQFDPQVVEALIACYRAGALVLPQPTPDPPAKR